MCLLSFSGVLFSIGSLIAPMFNAKNNRELPYKCLYSFDITISPLYEINYIIHCILIGYIINCAVLGFDYLFMGVGENLISQYILLGRSIEKFGTDNSRYLNIKIQKLDDGVVNVRTDDEDAVFLTNFIKQHQIIIK